MFELIIIFKHEMIGFLPKFQRNFELSGTSINHVRIKRSRPVLKFFMLYELCTTQ